MSVKNVGIVFLLFVVFVLQACKGDAKIKNQVEQISASTEMVEEQEANGVEIAEEVAEESDVLTDEIVEVTSENDVNTNIIAPAKDAVEEMKENSAKPSKETASTIENNGVSESKTTSNPKPIEPTNKPAVTNTAKPKAQGGKVLKEIKKPAADQAKDKVKVDEITKTSSASSTTTKIDHVQEQQVEFGHDAFDVLLKKVVSSNGVVDYSLLKGSSRGLNAYCKLLEENPPTEMWSRSENLAYWLNAYNAFTLKLIIDNYPVKSITDLDGGKPWDKKWINLDSKTLSLNDIENVIIRPRFKDARIHFAVNCAAKSCPPLANYAFTGKNVNTKMDALTKSFINSSANEISADKIVVSKIFDWYGEDFNDLITFINKYSSVNVNPGAKISFMDYDWTLNGK